MSRVGVGRPTHGSGCDRRRPIRAVDRHAARTIAVVKADVVESRASDARVRARQRDAHGAAGEIRIHVLDGVLVAPPARAEIGRARRDEERAFARRLRTAHDHARIERLPGPDRGLRAHDGAREREGRIAAGRRDGDRRVRGVVQTVPRACIAGRDRDLLHEELRARVQRRIDVAQRELQAPRDAAGVRRVRRREHERTREEFDVAARALVRLPAERVAGRRAGAAGPEIAVAHGGARAARVRFEQVG